MRLELPADRIAAVRFGISPLFELGAAARQVRRGIRGSVPHHIWDRWGAALARLDADPDAALVLSLLRNRRGSLIWVAGTPSTDRSFEDDLAAVFALDTDLLAADLSRYAGEQAPADVSRIESGLRTLWQALLEGIWPSVRSIVEDEVARVGTMLRTDGWARVFDSICDGMSWDGQALQLPGISTDDAHPTSDLVLCPSAFALSGPVVHSGVSGPSVIFFPARGIGNLLPGTGGDTTALSALLGPNRARVLLRLRHPTSVSRLRDALGLSLGSLSRHLSVLVASHLATSRRVGRTVEYEVTDVGRAVLDAQRGTE